MGEKRVVWWGNLKERDFLEEAGLNGSVILEGILNILKKYRQVVGYFERPQISCFI
jgi:hypothetical protein